MIEALGYLWLRPWWLALVLLALVGGLALWRQGARLGAWERAVDPVLLAAMQRMGRVIPGQRARNWLPAVVLAGIGVALAGPGTEQRSADSYRNLDAVVLVIDLSPEVARGPHLFDMLTTARLIARAAGTRQVGVVVYAGEAFVGAPLTSDGTALDGTIALLDGETMPLGGNRPAEGLAAARRMLADARVLSGDVVVIGAGVALDAATLTEVRALRVAGHAVSTVDVPGTSLAGLADGGKTGTLSDPYPVADLIARRPTARLAATGYAMLVIEDLGRYLLVVSLIAAFFLLPRRGTP